MVNVKGVAAVVEFPLPLPLPLPLEEEPPPQPEINNDPAITTAANATRNDHSKIRERFLALPNPNNEMNPQGMTQPKASLPPGSPGGAWLGANAD
jgi:hypothetical protein